MKPGPGQLLAIAAVALVPFLPALGGDFVLDDVVAVQGSACVTGEVGLDELLRRNFWCEAPGRETVDAWRPVPVLVWRLAWLVGGGAAWPFHALGLLLHATCAVLLARWTGHLLDEGDVDGRAGLVAGLVFAVLPIHTEVVASIVGVAEAWALAGGLCALLLAVRRDGHRWWALLALAMAVLSKESALVFGPLLLLMPWLARRGSGEEFDRGGALVGVAAMLVVLAYLAARAAARGQLSGAHVTGTVNPLVEMSLGARLPTAFDLLGRYLWLSLAGQPLSADYSFDAVPAGVWTPFAALGLLAAGGLVAVLVRGHAQAPVRVGVIWFIGAYALASNLVVLLPAMFAERLFYTPSAALCLLLGTAGAPLLASAHRLARPLRGLGVAFLVAWGALAGTHAFAWRSEASITEVTVQACPRSARARVWRARVMAREGAGEQMELEARAALEVLPEWAVAHALLGAALDLQGRPEEALTSFRRALELDAREGEAADLFVQFLLRYGLLEQARFVYSAHLEATGGRPDPRVTRPPP